MGHISRGPGGGDSKDNHYGDSSKSNSCDGLVQPQAEESMKFHISTNRNECKGGDPSTVRPVVGGDSKSLVEFLSDDLLLEEDRRVVWDPQLRFFAT